MSGYNSLAWFYNKYWTNEVPSLFYDILKEFFLPNIPTNGKILDLCCGTGQLASLLSEEYIVYGVDNSDIMLAIARKNAPKAKFILSDATDFQNMPSIKFDLVVSCFDSINHIMSIDKLKSCFSCVKSVLQENGTFLFDINDEDTFKDNWMAGFSAVEEDNVCILKSDYDPITFIANYKTTMFFKDENGIWQRDDSLVQERYYSEEIILSTLQDAGFSNIQIAHGESDFGVESFAGRQFFIANKMF